MKKRVKQLTPEEIDNLLESMEQDWLKDMKWKFITEEEIDTLLDK